MSLNCLTCQGLQRTNSENYESSSYNGEETSLERTICCIQISRNWSGPLSPPPYEKIRRDGPVMKVKKGHRRLNSTGAISFEGSGEPKLVRSSGMRRDWSFEDLRVRSLKRKGWGLC